MLAAGETDEAAEMLVALEDEAGPQPELVAHEGGEHVQGIAGVGGARDRATDVAERGVRRSRTGASPTS